MKKIRTLLCIAALSVKAAFAQSEFSTVWDTKANVNPEWNAFNDDLSLILVGDLKEIEMIDGTNGKSLWKFNAKEKLGVKSMEDWFFLFAKEGDPVEIVYKKPKEENKTSLYLDPRTGIINNSISEKDLKTKNNRPVRSKTKTMFAGSAYDPGSSTFLNINYNDRVLKSAVNGTNMDMEIQAMGGYNWTVNITGKCVRHLCDNLLSSDEPAMMVSLFCSNEKVFVVYEGISVLDLKTGKLLWTTSFDNVQSSVGLKASQEIGRSPMPVTSDDAVYICDFSKEEKTIKKIDITTGNVLWKSDKLKNDDVVSQLEIVNNTLIAKFGGTVRKEKFIPNANGGIGDGTYKVNYSYEGTTDVRAYDAATGKPKWNINTMYPDDKFSKSECSILIENNKIALCSDKHFFLLNPENGATLSKTPIDKTIGDPQILSTYQGMIILEGNKGIAAFNDNGDQSYAVNTGKRLFSEFKGDAFIVWTGKEIDDKNEFIRFDLKSGKIMGKLKGTYRPRFDTTGNYFLRFNDKAITKFKTNS